MLSLQLIQCESCKKEELEEWRHTSIILYLCTTSCQLHDLAALLWKRAPYLLCNIFARPERQYGRCGEEKNVLDCQKSNSDRLRYPGSYKYILHAEKNNFLFKWGKAYVIIKESCRWNVSTVSFLELITDVMQTILRALSSNKNYIEAGLTLQKSFKNF
jgi:hypothetical protein